MAEEVEKIGARMAERRKELGLTQREVAERLPGSNQGSDVSRWERGKHRPDILSEVAEALETTVADLVSGPLEGRKEPQKSGDLMESLSDAQSEADLKLQVAELFEALKAELGEKLDALNAEVKELRRSAGSSGRTRKSSGK